MRPRCPYTLLPLTKLKYIKRKFKCTHFEQDDFDEIVGKKVIVRAN